MTRKKPWGGRFTEPTNELVERFTGSVSFDSRLYKHDIRGSIAHARMLGRVGVLTQAECDAIVEGLNSIERDIEQGQFSWSEQLEDVHMNIEAELTERIGEVGKKLHTGRSRNDQVATDLRLWLREATDTVCSQLVALQQVLVDLAEREAETIMPGFTHLQVAQPVTLGHHLLAWFEMLQRDRERFRDARRRMNVLPLGSAALAGTTFPLDREFTAAELGFERPSENSLDAVSDRDFAVEFTAHAALLMIHLSRIAEELILWMSERYGFITIGDAFCTGSSIMPQKKNPDVAELIRGKSARVVGQLSALLVLMKSQPLAYNRDNQEDKEPVFDTVDTVTGCLQVLTALLPTMEVRRHAMLTAARAGFATATDLAEYLVGKGVPFRDAHEVVGRVVRDCIERKIGLDQLELDELQAFSPAIEGDVFSVLTLEGSVSARKHHGGTAPDQVKQAAARARERLREEH